MIKTFIDKLLGKSASGAGRGKKQKFGKREEVGHDVHGIDPELASQILNRVSAKFKASRAK